MGTWCVTVCQRSTPYPYPYPWHPFWKHRRWTRTHETLKLPMCWLRRRSSGTNGNKQNQVRNWESACVCCWWCSPCSSSIPPSNPADTSGSPSVPSSKTANQLDPALDSILSRLASIEASNEGPKESNVVLRALKEDNATLNNKLEEMNAKLEETNVTLQTTMEAVFRVSHFYSSSFLANLFDW